MTVTTFILALMLLGFLLLLVEIFVPGGILGTFGGLFLIAGILLSYKHFDPQIGTLMLIATLIVAIGIFFLAIKVFPHSPLGKRMILASNERRDEGYSAASDKLDELLGTSGVAVSVLRPAGVADFDGLRMDVVTEGEFVENGQPIKVIRVDGNRVVVERVQGV